MGDELRGKSDAPTSATMGPLQGHGTALYKFEVWANPNPDPNPNPDHDPNPNPSSGSNPKPKPNPTQVWANPVTETVEFKFCDAFGRKVELEGRGMEGETHHMGYPPADAIPCNTTADCPTRTLSLSLTLSRTLTAARAAARRRSAARRADGRAPSSTSTYSGLRGW